MRIELPASDEFLKELSAIDRFQGGWSAGAGISAPSVARLTEASRIRSVGASCRLAGIRIADAEVTALLRGELPVTTEGREVVGYAEAAATPLPPGGLLSTGHLAALHATLTAAEGSPRPPSPWRADRLERESFDADGKVVGRVFPTLPPRMVPEATEDLTTWLEIELRSRERHPVLVVGAFELYLSAISPFERGNRRLGRLLVPQLLARAGYDFVRCGSFEAELEELRIESQEASMTSRSMLWTDDADLAPWLSYFLKVLGRMRRRLERRVEIERSVQAFSQLQGAIVETVREHGSVDAALLLEATGANRNTLKDNLRKLVDRGVLRRTGQRRGTRYLLATGEEPLRVE